MEGAEGLESIDVAEAGVESRQYALIYPVTIMPREAVYSVYLEARKRAIQAGIAFLSGVSPRRIVVRQVRPEDLGLPGPEWRFSVRAGEVEILRRVMPRDRALVIFGVYNQAPQPRVQQLELWRNGSRRLILVLQELYTRGYDPMGVLAEFEVIRPGDLVRVLARSTGDGEELLGMMGYVAEPEGLISREPP
ncbi:MAG: hypothetical protein ACP5HK_05860 [Acidilobus sp.]